MTTVAANTSWDAETDFLVLGGGSAGCGLAERLSRDGRHRVTLVEAGPPDRHPMIHVPAGFLRLIDNPRTSWRMHSRADAANGERVIAYPQGRVLGGTGSLNGMLHVRSARPEHEDWLAQGCTGWGYDETRAYYERFENLDGAQPDRPLPVSSLRERHPLGDAFLQACSEVGLPVRPSHNGVQREGAGPFQQARQGRWRAGPAQRWLRRAAAAPTCGS